MVSAHDLQRHTLFVLEYNRDAAPRIVPMLIVVTDAPLGRAWTAPHMMSIAFSGACIRSVSML